MGVRCFGFREEGAKKLQMWLMVCAHVEKAGHRGAVATPPAAAGILLLVSHGGVGE